MIKNIYLFISVFALILSTSAYAQEPDWYKKLRLIKPLESTSGDVERVFGNIKPKSSFTNETGSMASYDISEGRFYVYYAAGQCSSTWKGDYNVDKGKVVEISFYNSKLVKLSNFNLNLGDFIREMENDNPTLHYRNDELGIDYSTERGKVKGVDIFPSSKFNHLKCEINQTGK